MPSIKTAPAPETTPSLLDDFYQQPELARELHVTTRTLQRWEELGIGPPMISIGRRTRIYNKQSVRLWLMAREPKQRPRGR